MNRTLSVLAILSSILLILNFSSCCGEGAPRAGTTRSVENDIESEMEVDLDNPIEVDLAILGARTVGNDDLADALTVVRGLRRADYEQKADAAKKKEDYRGAAENYNEALKWISADDKAQQPIRDKILKQMVVCYWNLADDDDNNLSYKEEAKYSNQAADAMIWAARYETNTDTKAEDYFRAACFKYDAGKKSEACNLLNKASTTTASFNLKDQFYRSNLHGYCKK